MHDGYQENDEYIAKPETLEQALGEHRKGASVLSRIERVCSKKQHRGKKRALRSNKEINPTICENTSYE